MGTRSVTTVYEYDKPLVAMYRQYDGYPDAHGRELAEFLASRSMVNGIGGGGKVFNGMQCLAAMMVSYFKGDEAGGFYLVPPGQTEEYNYHVTKKEDGCHVKVTDYNDKTLFDGHLDEFSSFIDSFNEEV